MNTNMKEKTALEEVIDLWKELQVDYLNFEFSCGGDSMNDTCIQIYDVNGNEVSCSEISDYIDDEIYKRVEFYVNSDGHYIGEAGNVNVRLSDDEEEFEYSKSSQSEWSESVESELKIEIDEPTIKFIKDKVLNINGEEHNGVVNYKVDCILSDEEEKIADKLVEKIVVECQSFSPEDYDIQDDWFRFTTANLDNDNNGIKIVDNKLLVYITQQFTEYKDELN